MHLLEILALRQTPGAGVYLSLTRRCPLSCAHCSTSSTLHSEEHDEQPFVDFVGSFTTADRPDVMVLTGGEPLLRPRLVTRLADTARAVGTRVVVASGMFFARSANVPAPIDRALDSVDHLAASLDVFHEREVPRAEVFRAVRDVLERGKDASFLVVGLNAADPYLDDVVGDIRRTFDDQVPIMIGVVQAQGRAARWLSASTARPGPPAPPSPCELASWPVVGFDGTVLACCNVSGSAPPAHLRLGQAGIDPWGVVRERSLTSPLLRGIRIYGPLHLAQGPGEGTVRCDGYCSTCHRLSDDPGLIETVGQLMTRPTTPVMEELVAEARREHFLYHHGPAGYEGLAALGYPGDAPVPSQEVVTA